MDIKDFILIVGGILIAAVIAHGVWVAWRSRNETLPLKVFTDRAVSAGKEPEFERHRWELPNGGARIAREEAHRQSGRDAPKQRSFELDAPIPRKPRPTQAAALRRAMDAELLGRAVQDPSAPVSRDLFEPSADAIVAPGAEDADAPRSVFAEADQLAAERAGVVEVTLPQQDTTLVTENRQVERGRVHNPPPAANQPLSEDPYNGPSASGPLEPSASGPLEPLASGPVEPSASGPVEPPTPGARPVGNRPADPDDVIVLYLLAPEGQRFAGNVICTSLMQHGLKFGDKNLFHRMRSDHAEPIFSVVNIVKPGFFDLAAIEDFSTPGIAFFMALPGPEDPLAAFDDMVRIAQRLCGAVQGRLMDDSRSMITTQTISHLRERVTGVHLRNYNRRAL